jgi:hypothetical protein
MLPNRKSIGVIEPVGRPKGFRRLKADELVKTGDFVADGRVGFTLWEGPAGFRSDSFVKPIYRRDQSAPVAARVLK